MKKVFMFTFLFLLFLFSLFIVSCNSNLNENLSDEFELRLDILYEHTLEMQRLSTDEQLEEIGLDISYLNKETAISNEDKIIQLEQSFEILDSDIQDSFESRILVLEDTMAQMMYLFATLE